MSKYNIISIIPEPVSMNRLDGCFILDANTSIITDDKAFNAVRELRSRVSMATGFQLIVTDKKEINSNFIEFKLKSDDTELNNNGYYLTVSSENIIINASTDAGFFYAVQTLLQLLPPMILSRENVTGVEWNIPCLEIKDYPRFTWRGAMLDVSRHFMPPEFIKRFIDLISLYKMNIFHWHLTDDQGWRIEIKKYPKLTDIGAWRKETLVGISCKKPSVFDGIPHGGYYTQDTIKEIIDYAKERHVTIVPEIDMPGHMQAAIAAYPELGNTDKCLEVLTSWGVSEDILNAKEETIVFMQNVLSEIIDLFPGRFIHIGGDEADKTKWEASTAMQKRIKDLGLKNEEELQSYFIKRMDKFLNDNGKSLIGWDEILEGGLASGASVMSWRGLDGGIEAAKAGHDVVMTPNRWTYFDSYQSEDKDKEPLAIGGYTSLKKVYSYDPIPEDLLSDKVKHILGTQGQIWTEYILDGNHVEYMAFPRIIALSEVAWSPLERKCYHDFIDKLKINLERLKVMGVNFHPLSPILHEERQRK